MKKLVMVAVVLMMSVAAMAQKGTSAVGVNLNYATSSDISPFGVGVKYQYEFIDNFRAEVAGNYYFAKKLGGVDMTEYDVDLTFHYLFSLAPKFNFYPAVGLAYDNVHASIDYLGVSASETESKLGFNFGGGVEYFLTNDIKANFEVKYQTQYDWVGFQIGVAYVF